MIYLPAGRGRRDADYNFSDALRFLSRALFFKHPFRTILTAVCLLQMFIFVSSYSRLQASSFYPTFEESANDVVHLSAREPQAPAAVKIDWPAEETEDETKEAEMEENTEEEAEEGSEEETEDDLEEVSESPVEEEEVAVAVDVTLEEIDGVGDRDFVQKILDLNAYKDNFMLKRYRKFIEVKRYLAKLAEASAASETAPKVTLELIGKSIQDKEIYCLRVEGRGGVVNKTR